MKINGVEVKGPSEEVLVLPRVTSPNLVFMAVAVRDTAQFDIICPAPRPKPKLVAGGWKESVDDPSYLEALQKHGELRFAWLLLKSLEPSNIEWDTVKADQPSTWLQWEEDLKTAGLSDTEVQHVINCVATANALNNQKLEAARESFLRGLAKASEKSSFQSSDLATTPSGEVVNESGSDLQE